MSHKLFVLLLIIYHPFDLHHSVFDFYSIVYYFYCYIVYQLRCYPAGWCLIGRVSGPKLLMKLLTESPHSSHTLCGSVGPASLYQAEAPSQSTCSMHR